MAPSLKETNRTLNGDLATVIVYPAILTKIPQTGWLIRSRGLFLAVLEVGGPRPKHRQIWGSGENPLPSSEMLSSPWVLTWQKGARNSLGVSFLRARIPFRQLQSQDLSTSQRAPSYYHHTGC